MSNAENVVKQLSVLLVSTVRNIFIYKTELKDIPIPVITILIKQQLTQVWESDLPYIHKWKKLTHQNSTEMYTYLTQICLFVYRELIKIQNKKKKLTMDVYNILQMVVAQSLYAGVVI